MHLPIQGVVSRSAGGSEPAGYKDNWVSHWSMEEASGNSADDHGSNTLVDNNTVTQATGIVGNARLFTAANLESFTVAAGHGLHAGTRDFTFWTWYNATTLPAVHALATVKIAGTNANRYDWVLQYDGARMKFYVPSASTFHVASATTFGALSTSTTYFILGQYNYATNTIGIKINNGTLDTAAGPTTPNNTGGQFISGASLIAGRYLDGWQDQMGFSPEILPQTHQDWLWNSGAGRAY